ncbi:hypothetical protein [Streptomyces sp. NPDC002692]
MANTNNKERDPFLEAVGRVTLAGGQIDHALRGLIGTITLEPTLSMHANAAKTQELVTIARLGLKGGKIDQPDADEIEASLKRVDRFRERRNTIVHALFMPAESGTGLDAMNPARKNIGYNTSSITVEEMEELADDAQLLIAELFRVGWNARAGKLPGMQPLPNPVPGQTVNGVQVKA